MNIKSVETCKCSECMHNNICMYKKALEEVYNSLSDMSDNDAESNAPFTININCTFKTSLTITRNVDTVPNSTTYTNDRQSQYPEYNQGVTGDYSPNTTAGCPPNYGSYFYPQAIPPQPPMMSYYQPPQQTPLNDVIRDPKSAIAHITDPRVRELVENAKEPGEIKTTQSGNGTVIQSTINSSPQPSKKNRKLTTEEKVEMSKNYAANQFIPKQESSGTYMSSQSIPSQTNTNTQSGESVSVAKDSE